MHLPRDSAALGGSLCSLVVGAESCLRAWLSSQCFRLGTEGVKVKICLTLSLTWDLKTFSKNASRGFVCELSLRLAGEATASKQSAVWGNRGTSGPGQPAPSTRSGRRGRGSRRQSFFPCVPSAREPDVSPHCQIRSHSSNRLRKRGPVKAGAGRCGAPGVLDAVSTRPARTHVGDTGFPASKVPRAGLSRGPAGV